jgi:hypothetical protein
MAAVYLAHDPQLDRLVALKVPRPVEDDRLVWRERFLAEARAAATLRHPNICPVFEIGEADSQPYLTMAYIEGETLAARQRRTGPLPIPEALALVRAVARAMAEAHARGIVHRDLKPANIIIDHLGQPVVMDFGLALRVTPTDDLRLTLSGVAMGTPAYMPPEQAGGDHGAIGPPADVYALGIILYELITGRVPFQGKTFGKLLAQIERDPPPLPSALNPAIDPELEAFILTALAKDPQQRFGTAGALADALDAYAQGERDVLVTKHGAAEQAGALTGPYIPADESIPPAGAAAKTATRRPRRIAIAAGVVGVGLLGLLAWVVSMRTDTPPAGGENGLGNQPTDPKRDPAKPIDFLKQATLVEIPGWQILTDAPKEEMQQWLDYHKKYQHSVVWLDAVQVGDKPVFAAVVALDERATEWVALLDLTQAEINNGNLMIANRLKGTRHVVRSASGFASDKQAMSTALLERGETPNILGAMPMNQARDALRQCDKQGYLVQLIRPYPVGEGKLWCVVYGEAHVGRKSVYDLDLNGTELDRELEKHRNDGHRPVSVVAYPNQDELRFAVTYQEDATKSAWEVHHDLTAADLKAKATESAAKGLTPASVTGCPWGGTVRYAAVWVKEPSREK